MYLYISFFFDTLYIISAKFCFVSIYMRKKKSKRKHKERQKKSTTEISLNAKNYKFINISIYHMLCFIFNVKIMNVAINII